MIFLLQQLFPNTFFPAQLKHDKFLIAKLIFLFVFFSGTFPARDENETTKELQQKVLIKSCIKGNSTLIFLPFFREQVLIS